MNYTLPTALGNRAPSFGVGDRFNDRHDRSSKIIKTVLNYLVDNPSPDSYRVGSAFEFNPEASFSKSKAYTFGVSRAAYDKVYIPS